MRPRYFLLNSARWYLVDEVAVMEVNAGEHTDWWEVTAALGGRSDGLVVPTALGGWRGMQGIPTPEAMALVWAVGSCCAVSCKRGNSPG